jgi:hypothetical protein
MFVWRARVGHAETGCLTNIGKTGMSSATGDSGI